MGVFLSVSRCDWCAFLSHPSSSMLMNHGPSQQSSKEEYKSWKWGAAARYYASRTKTMFIIIIINLLTARVARAPQMILQPVFSIFPCSPLPQGLAKLQACPFPYVVFPPLSLSTLSSSPFYCALQDGFGQAWWTRDMTIPLQYASLSDGQEVFMWSNCLLDLGMDFLVGNMVFLWDV